MDSPELPCENQESPDLCRPPLDKILESEPPDEVSKDEISEAIEEHYKSNADMSPLMSGEEDGAVGMTEGGFQTSLGHKRIQTVLDERDKYRKQINNQRQTIQTYEMLLKMGEENSKVP